MKRIVLVSLLSMVFLFGLAGTSLGTTMTIPVGHPANPGDCYSCHAGHFYAYSCDDCHGTKYPRINRTGYLSPTPPVVTFDTPSHQVVHSNYSANTDACASCHRTHTSVGENLLQWVDSTTACMACHDGTIGSTYNVKAGQIGTTGAKTSAGLFGTGTEPGLSNHNMYGELTTAAAWGGSEKNSLPDKNGSWNILINCVACHSPHGQGGNSRILTPDPNGIAMQNKVTGEVLTVVTAGTTYKAAKSNWIKGYPYLNDTKIKVGGASQTTGFTVDYRTGIVTFNPAIAPDSVVTADYVPGIRVIMNVADKLIASETVTYNGGINQFCGACHTDYNTSTVSGPNTGSGHTLTGQYRSAYRHQVGMIWDDAARGTNVIAGGGLKFESISGTTGRVMCLTCHFAHGTDDEFSGSTTTDTTRSTAQKRQVNMSLCETCHEKGKASNY
ncbi:MAG: cytochrome c3 family protein [Desulfitobacteriaceae bacterium]|nr:cytochrome c3 family protein [Desulfitobacteriaceae bacterium]MDI6912776.1 cytochrome c3 family protein [Desulfitobacteriaceae bacterium]